MKVTTEAPASANVRVQTQNGYQWQITMRTETVKDLVSQIKVMEALFANESWSVPEWQKDEDKPKKYEPEYVEGRVCPTCGEKLVYAKKQDGTKFIKCSTNKWNKFKKKAEGCPYVEWDIKDGDVTDEDIPDPVQDW